MDKDVKPCVLGEVEVHVLLFHFFGLSKNTFGHDFESAASTVG